MLHKTMNFQRRERLFPAEDICKDINSESTCSLASPRHVSAHRRVWPCINQGSIREAEPYELHRGRNLLWRLDFTQSWERSMMGRSMQACWLCIWSWI